MILKYGHVQTKKQLYIHIYIYIVFVAVGFGFIPPLPTNCRSIVWQQKTREPEGKQ